VSCIIVNDASALIDLKKGELLHVLGALPVKLTSPLTALLIDMTVKKMTKDQIRKNYTEGKYKGASPDHVAAYVKEHFGG